MLSRKNSGAERSKRRLSGALFSLMEEQPFDTITVTDIAKRADYTRQTFYQHFETKEDVVVYYLADRFDRYFEQLKKVKFNDRDTLLNAVCTVAMKVYWDTSNDYANLIVTNNLTNVLVQFLAAAWREFFEYYHDFFPLTQYNDVERQYMFEYIAGGPLAIIYSWRKSGKEISSEEFEHLLYRLIRPAVL